MGSDNKVLTLAEIFIHNNSKDCWVIINAKCWIQTEKHFNSSLQAYDVTNFLADHPGGDEILLAAAGKDASEEFEDAGHGSAARLMLDEFYAGEMDPSITVTRSKYVPPKQLRENEEKSPGLLAKLLPIPVPLAILGLGSAGLNLSSLLPST
ncbi:hypothetical protein RJ639_025995 [Escallonia herrerae]|uniref:Cytochrome b5 heme-binding domain-containing protein n=1 Tax=Escallonia herrerae TaxID=1293975 RepID=A0AA89ACE2_9ASTE|nr:hypothetical protein RJ639_025995 [Escallonia herrerae]